MAPPQGPAPLWTGACRLGSPVELSLGPWSRGAPAAVETRPAVTLPAVEAGLLQGSLTARTPRASEPKELASHLREAYGRTMETLRVGDVRRNPQLRTELADLPLNAYFDGRGAPRFRRLGLTFAAKQNECVRSAFGNWVDDEKSALGGPKKQSAKAYLLAAEAVERDMEYGKKRTREILCSLDSSQKLVASDVQRRQLEVLFMEVPHFEDYLPMGIRDEHLLPIEMTKEEERLNWNYYEKTMGYLMDRMWRIGAKNNWMLTRGEVVYLSVVTNLWMKATHGKSFAVGMDRATYCRLVLDLGLVDQERVPYYWAVSLFDEAAKPMRLCSPATDATLAHLSPVKPIVSRWALMGILDLFIRLHFTEDTKGTFFASLLPIAKMRLPAYIVEESGLREEMLRKYLNNADILVLGGPNGEGGWESFGVKMPTEKNEDRDGNSIIIPPAKGQAAQTEAGSLAEAEIKREHLARETMASAMILEPEVLHILAQHHELFQKLHVCYASEAGDLPFSALLQFCVDFNLTPQIVSANFVKRVYETAASVERWPREKPGPTPNCEKKHTSPSPSGRTEPEAGVRSGSRKRAPAMKKQGTVFAKNEREHSRQNRDDSPADEQEQWPPALPWVGAAQLAGQVSLVDKPVRVMIVGARNLRCADRGDPDKFTERVDSYCTCTVKGKSSYSIQTKVANNTQDPVWQHEDRFTDFEIGDALEFSIWSPGKVEPELLGRATVPSAKFQKDGYIGEVPLDVPRGTPPYLKVKIKLVAADPREHLMGRQPCFFGVGAFMEVLCRLAFMYLGQYGNMQQQGSSALARTVWLLVYLHSAFAHLRHSLEKRSAEGEPSLHAPLRKALLQPAELWAATFDAKAHRLPATTMRPGPLKEEKEAVLKKKSKKVLVQAPEGVDEGLKAVLFTSRLRRRGQSSLKRRSEASRGPEELPAAPVELEEVQQQPQPQQLQQPGPAVLPPDEAYPQCVVDGLCQVCGSTGGVPLWGNISCWGCSVVDLINFRTHPIRPLLLDVHPALKPVAPSAAIPPKLERTELTPPPLGRNDVLRE